MAVIYTHSRGVVHGDIHLRNVLVKLPSSVDQFYIEAYTKNTMSPRQSPLPNAANSRFLPTFRPRLSCLFISEKMHKSFLHPTRMSCSVILERHSYQDTQTVLPCNFQKLDSHHSLLSPTQRTSRVYGMKAVCNGEFAIADDIFAQQIYVLGESSLPLEWCKAWKQRSKLFLLSGQSIKIPKESRYLRPPVDDMFEEELQRISTAKSRDERVW